MKWPASRASPLLGRAKAEEWSTMAKSSAKVGGGRVRQALLADPEGVPAIWSACAVRSRRCGSRLPKQLSSVACWRPEADERPTRLMTVPGVGPVTVARFVTAILARGDDRAHNHRDAQPAITLIRLRLPHE